MSEKKKERIAKAIERATARELIKLQDNNLYGEHNPALINNWKGNALASWITPGIIRAAERALSPPRRKK